MTKDKLLEIWRLLQETSKKDQGRLFEQLRREFPIHSLEQEWNVSADLILEAISRSSDLTKRGVRGVIAEAAFEQSVVRPHVSRGWKNKTPEGDHPFDFLLEDERGLVKIQVKMQRLEKRFRNCGVLPQNSSLWKPKKRAVGPTVQDRLPVLTALMNLIFWPFACIPLAEIGASSVTQLRIGFCRVRTLIND